MDEIGYEVYRLTPRADIEHLRFRPYHYLQTKGIRATVDNYIMIYRSEAEKALSAKEIRSQLEADPPPPLVAQPLGLSDVIAVTKAGITSAFYVDPTKLILLPDFFHQPNSGVLITMDTNNWPLDGRKGSWMTIDTLRIDGRDLYLMQSQDYGREAPYVIVNEQGKELAADPKGFSDETVEKIRLSLKELEARQAADISLATDKKPKLEIWQQYFENGEYLRAAEISEEQNYNMIDGTANNRAPKRSVLERLQEKQSVVKHVPSPMQTPELLNESEIERTRK